MSKLLYALEDYFDALADERAGYWSGRLSRSLGTLFAVFGDVLRMSPAVRRF